MRLGNAAWGLRELPIEEKLKITKDMGLELLELSISGHPKDCLTGDSTEAEIAKIRQLYASYGISPFCGCTGNDFTEATEDSVKANLAQVLKVIQVASKVGVKHLRIFAGFSSDSEIYGARLQLMLDALRQSAACAAQHGVILTVETHGGVKRIGDAVYHVASVTTRMDIWARILETGVSMLYDPANLSAVGDGDPCAIFREYRQHVKSIHLKDFKDYGGGVIPVSCGEGRLDWGKVKATLADFAGPALFEYENPEDVEQGLRRCRDFWLA